MTSSFHSQQSAVDPHGSTAGRPGFLKMESGRSPHHSYWNSIPNLAAHFLFLTIPRSRPARQVESPTAEHPRGLASGKMLFPLGCAILRETPVISGGGHDTQHSVVPAASDGRSLGSPASPQAWDYRGVWAVLTSRSNRRASCRWGPSFRIQPAAFSAPARSPRARCTCTRSAAMVSRFPPCVMR